MHYHMLFGIIKLLLHECLRIMKIYSTKKNHISQGRMYKIIYCQNIRICPMILFSLRMFIIPKNIYLKFSLKYRLSPHITTLLIFHNNVCIICLQLVKILQVTSLFNAYHFTAWILLFIIDSLFNFVFRLRVNNLLYALYRQTLY